MIQDNKLKQVSKEDLEVLIQWLSKIKMRNAIIKFCQEEPFYSKYRTNGSYWKGFRLECISIDRMVMFFFQLLKDNNTKIVNLLKENVYKRLNVTPEEEDETIQNTILKEEDEKLISILLSIFNISYGISYEEYQSKRMEDASAHKTELDTLKGMYEEQIQKLKAECSQSQSKVKQLKEENEHLHTVWTHVQEDLQQVDASGALADVQALHVDDKRELQQVLETMLKTNFESHKHSESLDKKLILEYVLYKMLEVED